MSSSNKSGISRRDLFGVAVASLIAGEHAQAQIFVSTRNYYIAASGNDSNPGTLASPWLTIGKVSANTMLTGDVYHFNGGDTFTDATLTLNSGSVRVTSYGTGLATISLSAATGCTVTDRSNIIIDSLIFVGTAGTTQAGISINCTGTNKISNITVSNCVVSGFAGNGIEFIATTGGIITNPKVLNCTVHDNTKIKTGNQGSSGIHFFGTYGSQTSGVYNFQNALVSNCIAYNNTGATGATNWVGSGIFLSSSSNSSIKNSTGHDNGANNTFAGAGPVGIYLFDSINSQIVSCESYLAKTQTVDGDGFDCDGGVINCTIEYSYSHQNQGHGILIFSYSDGFVTANTGSTIRFCVAEKNASNATAQQGDIVVFNASGTTSGVAVYNNTVYASTIRATCGALALVNSSTGVIANNIFFAASGTNIIATTGTLGAIGLHSNDYWTPGAFVIKWSGTTYSSLATWQAATSQDATGLNVDPTLTNPGNGGTIGAGNPLSGLTAYLLLGGSPMIHTGINLTTSFSINPGSQDFYSNAITAATLSIGAHCP